MRRTHVQLNIRRVLAPVLAALILFAAISFAGPLTVSAAESGTCGDGLTWSLSAGTLTISGQGTMTRYNELDMPPWYALRNQIYRVVLPEGLHNISSFAFFRCENLRTIYLPDSVTKIGSYAFSDCTGLESVRFSEKLAVIDSAAFRNCYRLTAMSLPRGLQTLGNQAFYRCESLTAVTIPPYLSTMGTSAFSYCIGLIRVDISARLGKLPEWSFYGCENLSVVILPETVGELEEYAFKKCDVLETVHFGGTDEKRQAIQASLEKELPRFEQVGSITSDAPMTSTTVGSFSTHDDGTVTQRNTTVQNGEGMTLVTVLEHTYNEGNVSGGAYNAKLTVTVEDTEAWDKVVDSVAGTLKEYADSFSVGNASADTVDLTVYVQTVGGAAASLVEEMAGRDVKLTVISSNGSESRVDCGDVAREDLKGSYDYSHSIEEAPADRAESLGTEDCFLVNFHESASVNTEVLVKLPEVPAHSNAYLYQVEEDDSLTRLQATVVDPNGNAHFYVGAVDKDTQYVVGVNVPGEKTDDAIIPDELLSQYGSAVERLEKIDYVITGRESSWGMSMAQVTWIMLGVLAACIIAVGAGMAFWNARRLKRGYVPDLAGYEDPDSPSDNGS